MHKERICNVSLQCVCAMRLCMEGKMKVLLAAVNAKYIHSNPAVYSLKAYAQERLKTAGLGRTKIQIEISEYTINQQTDAILSDLYRKKPDVAAFSCYIWNWRMIRELSAELAKVLPGVPIWLGGPEVSFDAERILEEIPAVSGIMVGEGEQTFTELLEYYADTADMSANGKRGKGGKSGSGLGKIDGIVYRKERQIFRTGVRKQRISVRCPFYIKIWKISATVLFITSQAVGVRSGAVTVYLPSTGACGCGIWKP